MLNIPYLCMDGLGEYESMMDKESMNMNGWRAR